MSSRKPVSKKKSGKERIRAAITRAYNLGYAVGRNERQEFLNCLTITNGHLWKELKRLDQDSPEHGIQLSSQFADLLAKAVEKRHAGYASQLRKKIRQSNQRFDKVLDILKQFKDFK